MGSKPPDQNPYVQRISDFLAKLEHSGGLRSDRRGILTPPMPADDAIAMAIAAWPALPPEAQAAILSTAKLWARQNGNVGRAR